MKAKIYLSIVITLLFSAGCYQVKKAESEVNSSLEDSKAQLFPITSKNLDSQETKSLIVNLELLGKLWGFLKYHHPEVAKGNYNWDNELFKILPQYIKADGTTQRDEILLQWIEEYGAIPECTTCKETSSDAVLKPDLSWIEQFSMSTVLKEKIREIYQNRHQGEHYYIKKHRDAGNPVFLNEDSYSYLNRIEAELRLLALYRYWNMVQYFFPYKHLTDKNWNDVLKEYIPKFVLAETELAYQLAVLQLTGEINDTHAQLRGGDKIDSLRGDWQAPFGVRFIENRLVVVKKSTLKKTAGLDIGDVITHINGKSIEYIVDSIKIYYPASNEAVRLNNLANDLVRSTKNSITIDYISSDGMHRKAEQRLYDRKIMNSRNIIGKESNDPEYKIIRREDILVSTEQIGYVYIGRVISDVSAMKEKFMNTKGIIIDIRNYPYTSFLYSLGSYFASEDTPFAKFTVANLQNPGEFTFNKAVKIINYSEGSINQSKDLYQGKLVVIVNEVTQSHAEFTAMVFRAGNNTTIIGSQTSGADGNASFIVLPGGLTTVISGIGVYYPDGRETQRVGIIPDIEVRPTIQGIREGRDELLEKAIEIIRQL